MENIFRFLDKHGENIKDTVILVTSAIAIFGLIAINTPEMPWQLQGLGAAGLVLSIPIVATFGLANSTWN